jgi:hypothetical protein
MNAQENLTTKFVPAKQDIATILKLLDILTFIPLFIIIYGMISNTLSYFIFKFNKELSKMPNMVVYSFVCITDTLALFIWNFNNFLTPHFGIVLENTNIYSCRILLFLQYFSLQSSELLITYTTIDRYIKVTSEPGSTMSRLPFGTVKAARNWSLIILGIVAVLNSFLIFCDRLTIVEYENDPFNPNRTIKIERIDCYSLSNGDSITSVWDYVHLFLYSIIPFLCMVIFNFLLLKKSCINSENAHLNKARKQIINILIASFAFLSLTMPSSIFYIISTNMDETIYTTFMLLIFQISLFLNHTLVFFKCYFSNIKLRKLVNQICKDSFLKFKNKFF